MKFSDASDTTCGHKASDITPAIACLEERGVEKKRKRSTIWLRTKTTTITTTTANKKERKKERKKGKKERRRRRGPSSFRGTLEPFQRQRCLRRGGARMGFFERVTSILNTKPELNCEVK